MSFNRPLKYREDEDKPIPPEPVKERIPVRLDERTVLMIPKGANIEEHLKRYRERSICSVGSFQY